MADEKKVPHTGINTHVARARGYAADALIEPGEFVPPDVPIADIDDDGGWMEPVDKKTARMLQAADEATDKQPGDVDLTKLSPEALEAMAAERGINVGGLNKKQLIDAIKAAHAQTA